MKTEKLDLYKLHKDEYITPKTPQVVKVKQAKYLAFTGQGAPESEAFSKAISALYAVAYTIKMTKKFAGQDYRVCAVEGFWWSSTAGDFMAQPREAWNWKIVIRVPDFITSRDLAAAVSELLEKGKSPEVKNVRLEKITEGKCVQVLHVGPYTTEHETIARMKEFAEAQGLEFHGLHHEIYLSDPRRVAPARLKTILRMPVR
jgi:hypothetical protein